MFVVVAYDIADDRRRLRALKMLRGYGEHVQESVFECDLDPKTYRKMLERLRATINLKEDNVRVYHLCNADVDRIIQLGVGRPVQVAREFWIV
jgi:CRISPR-associated protein Cas2